MAAAPSCAQNEVGLIGSAPAAPLVRPPPSGGPSAPAAAAARRRAYGPRRARQEEAGRPCQARQAGRAVQEGVQAEPCKPTHSSTACILVPAAASQGHRGTRAAPTTPAEAPAEGLPAEAPPAVVARAPVQAVATAVAPKGAAAALPAVPPAVVARTLVQAGRHLGLLFLVFPVLCRVPADPDRLLPGLGRCLGGLLPQLACGLGGLVALGGKRQVAGSGAHQAALEAEAGEPPEVKGGACGCASSTAAGDSDSDSDSDSSATASVE